MFRAYIASSRWLPVAAAAAISCLGSGALSAAAPNIETTLTAVPGSLLRWSAPGTQSCRDGARSWLSLHGTCYFPIDILQRPGPVTLARLGDDESESARINVEAHDYGTERTRLSNIPQRDPSTADLARHAREILLLKEIWQGSERTAEFALPLGPPVRPLPPGSAFGVKRVFNGKLSPQPQMGLDYAAAAGSPVLAVADGIVVLAQDLFFAGNAVFIDHGDGLISMSFHLSGISVRKGQSVSRGQTVGRVGATGRTNEAHLFFAMRWHDSRIDPRFLLQDTERIPTVRDALPMLLGSGENRTTAMQK